MGLGERIKGFITRSDKESVGEGEVFDGGNGFAEVKEGGVVAGENAQGLAGERGQKDGQRSANSIGEGNSVVAVNVGEGNIGENAERGAKRVEVNSIGAVNLGEGKIGERLDAESVGVRSAGTESRTEFLKRAAEDAKVRELIIGQYLRSIRAGSVRLMGDKDAVYTVSPPKKPKTIAEAGDIVRKFL